MTCTMQSFLADVAGHSLSIRHDEGGFRHLEFGAKGSCNNWFSITTWPGVLTIHGDHGSYVFSRRADDMFAFFRTQGSADGHPVELTINPDHWSTKLTAVNCHRGEGSIYAFSDAKCEALARDWFNAHFEDEIHADALLKSQQGITAEQQTALMERQALRGDCWDSLHDIVTNSQSYEQFADAIGNFTHDRGFDVTDVCSELTVPDVSEWCYHYLWCLFAIVYGIQQYDRSIAASASIPSSAVAA